ncbi:MAG: hypothetical protein ACYDAN_01935 [Candidatus Limnocylindrales bacterium]
MKLSKTIGLPLATAALVIVGTGAVLASTAPAAPSAAGAIVPAAPSTSAAPAASTAPVAPYLRSVLDPLVTKGTITGGQEQAIIDAWVAKRAETQAELKQLRAFLSDGVLTADELAQLPADSPLQQLKPLMKNGQLTVADMRALGRGILRELRLGRAGASAGAPGLGGLPGLGGGVATPSTSPSAGG